MQTRKEYHSQKKYNTRIRMSILQHYSGSDVPCCNCCGEKHIEFLALDHVEGSGNQHRHKVGHGRGAYHWIINNNFPPIYRVLCHNCNAAIGYYGYCPHEKDIE